MMNTESTERLHISRITEADRPGEFLELFNSNPDFVEATDQFAGKRSYDLSDAEMHLWQTTAMENSHGLALRLRGTGELVGTASLLVPHYREPYPWIGLLLIHGAYQRQGLGTGAARAIETALQREGWPEVRRAVLQACPGERRFWEGLGYVEYGERVDQDKRPCWLLRKPLSAQVAPAGLSAERLRATT
jgi:RimJ/RimL family protein N-acetyltransferase